MRSLNAHNLLIFQPILMILASEFMVHRALSDKIYSPLGLLSPLNSDSSESSGDPMTSRRRSIPVFLRKHETSQVVPGGGEGVRTRSLSKCTESS